jgi:hypothetical protein
MRGSRLWLCLCRNWSSIILINNNIAKRDGGANGGGKLKGETVLVKKTLVNLLW